VVDRGPGPADLVGGFQVGEQPVRLPQAAETDHSGGNLILRVRNGRDVRHEHFDDGGEIAVVTDGPQGRSAGQQQAGIILVLGSQLHDLRLRNIVLLILDALPDLIKGFFRFH